MRYERKLIRGPSLASIVFAVVSVISLIKGIVALTIGAVVAALVFAGLQLVAAWRRGSQPSCSPFSPLLPQAASAVAAHRTAMHLCPVDDTRRRAARRRAMPGDRRQRVLGPRGQR
jgi:hypothetical protein